MIEISKNEFLSSMTDRFSDDLTPESIRRNLEEVWEQATGQALLDSKERWLQHELGQAVMRNGGPAEVAKIIGTSEDTVKRWVVHPLDMNVRDLGRFQNATGLSIEFTVLNPLNKDD